MSIITNAPPIFDIALPITSILNIPINWVAAIKTIIIPINAAIALRPCFNIASSIPPSILTTAAISNIATPILANVPPSLAISCPLLPRALIIRISATDIAINPAIV